MINLIDGATTGMETRGPAKKHGYIAFSVLFLPNRQCANAKVACFLDLHISKDEILILMIIAPLLSMRGPSETGFTVNYRFTGSEFRNAA